MRRIPVLPTIVVGLAVAAMIALGVWQLDRRTEKEAAIALIAGNVARAPVAFPADGGGDALLFRRSAVDCARVDGWQRQSGRSANGTPGWRLIARCATPGGQADVPVQLGIAARPDGGTAWNGGRVAGYLSHAPDGQSLIERALTPAPRRLMLVADVPPAGLAPNARPDLSAVPNNHLAYAVQWFLFAAIAAIIYIVALRRRAAGER